ncbi:MAG: alpha/beta fold hydrolase [Pseudonocardiaceae bacterium]
MTDIRRREPSASGELPPPNAELLPPDESQPPWPGRVETVDGVRLHVRRTDPSRNQEDAPTAVYVHGLGGSSTNWTDLGAALAPWGRGVAVDLPGFGFSEPEPDFDYSLRAHVVSLGSYVAGLDVGPVHLLGNSMGGAIAALLAAHRPDLVRTLTLISPAMPDLRPDPRRLSDPRMALAFLPVVGPRVRRRLAMLTPRERAQQVIDLCFADPSSFPQQRLDELAEEHGARMELTWATPALARSTMQIFRTWVTPGVGSLWSSLPKISAPALVVWGAEDKVVSARKAERTARLLPRGRLMVMPRTGHVAQMERPADVAKAVLGMWHAVEDGRW